MQEIINLKNVSKFYQTDTVKTVALNEINMSVNEGDFISISGASGCGKSTLLSIIGLLDDSSSGDMFIKGINTSELSFDQKSIIRNNHLGMIFQSFNLLESETVFGNVALPLVYRGVKKAKIKERVEKAVNDVGLSHRILHNPKQLSGGQQQRVAIARALVGEPDVILADEATGNLDSKSSQEIMALLGNLNQAGKTICYVTHEKHFADLAEQKFTIVDGRISKV
ncbi:ABC transporter ATP-binding protein [Pseudoalteromonas rhizosphaerae]|uniref:ABC transporter ATP-binding protein n=1 Tax=Pseudoalteromonas rhizosphaerae TaxID=2518973 RepID=UPI00384AB91D